MKVKIVGYDGNGEKMVIAKNVNMDIALAMISSLPHYTDIISGTVYTTYIEQ